VSFFRGEREMGYIIDGGRSGEHDRRRVFAREWSCGDLRSRRAIFCRPLSEMGAGGEVLSLIVLPGLFPSPGAVPELARSRSRAKSTLDGADAYQRSRIVFSAVGGSRQRVVI